MNRDTYCTIIWTYYGDVGMDADIPEKATRQSLALVADVISAIGSAEDPADPGAKLVAELEAARKEAGIRLRNSATEWEWI